MKAQISDMASARPIGLGLSAVALFILLGCATQQQVGVGHPSAPPAAQVIQLEPGLIVVTPSHIPARFSFEKADGQIDYPGERAGNIARRVMAVPRLGIPDLEAAWSAGGVAVAPFAAAVSAISAKCSRLSPEKLAAVEANLTQAMTMMADQRSFRDWVLKTGNERSRGSLVPVEALAAAPREAGPVGAVLETRVEELRLERTGKRDTSFALRIKGRVRLLRADDQAVLYDYPFEHRTGTALFLDWTCQDAFRGVADTAYRALAAQVADVLLPANPEAPVCVGAGYKKAPAPKPDLPVALVARQTPPPAEVRFASFSMGNEGAVGVFSAATPAYVALQRPLTKGDAVPAAMEEVNWSLDGLQNSRNQVVQIASLVPAIPISLWHQAVIGIGCPSAMKCAAAEAQLSAAVRQIRLQKELACAVAHYMAPRTPQPVVLVEGTLPASDGGAPIAAPAGARAANAPAAFAAAGSSRAGATLCGLRGTRVGASAGQFTDHYVLGQGPDTALEIKVLSAALTGKGQANPPLAVCVEAQARLLRVSDGAELFSGRVHYRSPEHKYTEWAARDARLFRLEIEQCYRDLSRATVDQLTAHRLIAPEVSPHPTLTARSK